MPDIDDFARVRIADLVPDPKNARRGSVGELVKSIREFGQHRPLVVQRGTNRVIVGNHMLQALQSLGHEDALVLWVDDDDDTAIRRGLADNLTGDRAVWDDSQLGSLLAELGGGDPNAVELPGLTPDILKAVLPKPDDDTGAGPQYPIVARPGEGYDYVMIVGMSEIDNAWLRTVFGLRQERSWSNTDIGLSRVVTVKQMREAFNRFLDAGTRFE